MNCGVIKMATIINLVRINDRFVVKEYRERYENSEGAYTEIYDIKKHLLIQLHSNGSINYRDVGEAEIEKNAEKIKISDGMFRTITGHRVVIVENKSLLISCDGKGHELKKVIEAIKKMER